MRKGICCGLLLCLLLLGGSTYSQEKTTAHYGNITPKDFEKRSYAIDSAANAIVVADVGSTRIEGNNKNWFSLNFKRFTRVHILNKNGYDAGNVSIDFYTNGEDEERLERLKAVTYNLENGKVVQTRLDVKDAVFKEKINSNIVRKKFTFPNIKEGSIIELEYVVVSDFLFNLRPWEFQGDIPVLWSEYNLEMPDFFNYVFLSQGDKTYDIRTKDSKRDYFKILESRSAGSSPSTGFDANVTVHRWVKKDVPALKEESFTSTLRNHIAKVEFQLSEYRHPLQYRNILGSWQTVAKQLMEADYFGAQLTKENSWLKDQIAPLIKSISDTLEQAKLLYSWVRDNYTCTHYSANTDQTLKSLSKTRKGNVAEINLLLTAMLRYINITADPVILSTRSHGYTYSIYPIMSKFNYVICKAQINDQSVLLDASEPGLGFGHLPLRCYNGHARIINEAVEPVELQSNMINEVKYTSVFIVNNNKGNLIGSQQETAGYYASFEVRNKIRDDGLDGFRKDLQREYGSDIELKNLTVDSLNNKDVPLTIKYDFDFTAEKEDIYYLNPIIGDRYKENPFKSAQRLYPVEMPYAFDNIYSLQLEVPEGYVVDELPKSIVVKLNEEGEGLFEYRISQSGSTISFRSRVKISRTVFAPDEYDMLREFFSLIVKKQSEQIVFKKKVKP